MMEIFDCHVHIFNGLEDYNLDVRGMNIIFNQVETYQKWKDHFQSNWSVSLIFDFKNNLAFVKEQIASGRIDALKVHSRIQKLSPTDYRDLKESLKEVPSGLPVILDAFYYGDELEFNPNLDQFIQLIKFFPERKFIIAHCGGYEVLKYFFHLRTLPNVYYDLSLSLQYFVDSSLRQDYVKLLKYTPASKVLFGSDYPYASPRLQMEILEGMLKHLQIKKEDVRKMTYDNAKTIFEK